jgi:hypothetical protein
MAKKPSRRRSGFRLTKEVRKLARERVGQVPAARVIQPKPGRKKPKHPKREDEVWIEW